MSIVKAALFSSTGGSLYVARWFHFPGRVALFGRADGSNKSKFTPFDDLLGVTGEDVVDIDEFQGIEDCSLSENPCS